MKNIKELNWSEKLSIVYQHDPRILLVPNTIRHLDAIVEQILTLHIN
jgi:hypothetical protein